ncbi:Uncharacterized conserved protein [Cedecea lapagei]|uniref:Uncharacterized conserved protein n=1 Tax=Cedecea lapagei TaxID=158823 RepID=A0A3S5DPR9_9ENTR|nr:DUF2164 family protein [Cedecea lapagei]VEB98029.1 Uncharacterized conserved protein [Cedecea lapagei]
MKKLELPAEDYRKLSDFITDWLDEKHDLQVGQFEAEFLLDELVKRLAPVLYNKGLDDALAVAQSNMLTLEELLDLEKVVG